MMFYEGHRLINSGTDGSWFNQYLPSHQDVEDTIKSANNALTKYWEKTKCKITSIEIYAIKNSNNSLCTITMRCNYNFKHGEEDRQSNISLAGCTISTVPYNCGAIHVSNIHSGEYSSLHYGLKLYQAVEDYLAYAGYTFLFGNTSGEQNKFVPKFIELGYKRMAESYMNPRSHNTNIWMYKLLNDGGNIQPDDDENQDDDYDEDDEDF